MQPGLDLALAGFLDVLTHTETEPEPCLKKTKNQNKTEKTNPKYEGQFLSECPQKSLMCPEAGGSWQVHGLQECDCQPCVRQWGLVQREGHREHGLGWFISLPSPPCSLLSDHRDVSHFPRDRPFHCGFLLWNQLCTGPL